MNWVMRKWKLTLIEAARRKKKILGSKWEQNRGCRKAGKKKSGVSTNGWFSAGNWVSGQFQPGKMNFEDKRGSRIKGWITARQGVQTKNSWPSSIMFRPGWNRKIYQCSLLSSPMLSIYFWMPLNSEKCLWDQLCCHYLLVCLDLKIKQEPTTASKNAMSSNERALHN